MELKKKRDEFLDHKILPEDIRPLCVYCFDVLIRKLKSINEEIIFPEDYLKIKCPLFVTWKFGLNLELRGCIGTFESEYLTKNLEKYALISALEDDRFNPIKQDEIEDLHVEVSLLVKFENCKDIFDWEVGKHGIEIEFKPKNRQRTLSATFLPEVAKEEEWDKETTLKNLVQKAGFYGNFDKVSDLIKAVRYQSISSTISYKDFLKYDKLE